MSESPRTGRFRDGNGAAFVVVILLAAWCTAGGCGRKTTIPGGDAESPPSLEEQIAAVRDGASRRIHMIRPILGAQWNEFRALAGLVEITVEQGVADDTVAEILATLPDLERLVLRDSPLTDEGFHALAACPRLRDLNVPRSACTHVGIRSLARIDTLRSLRLGGEGLRGPEVCEAIATLPALRSLHLIDVPIGDRGLDVLGRLPGLVNLYLDGAGVSDAAWRGYFDDHPGVHVHVDQSHHDRDPRAHAH